MFDIVLLILVIGGFAAVVWLLHNNQGQNNDTDTRQELEKLRQENADLKAKMDQQGHEIGKLTSALDNEKSERNKLEGNGKQMMAQMMGYKEENKMLREQKDELKEKVTKIETDRERWEKDRARETEQLENARNKLQEEQERVKREDEEKLEEEKQERDRIWNDHENLVISKLKEVCQLQQIGFQYYENTKLPEGFDGSLKPDFLVDFLGQYIVFDAKKSRNLSTYLNDQVKSTAAKVKKSSSEADIYKVVFFVVPTDDLQEVKKTYFYEEGISFFAVSIEALEAILAAYKRITEYENISEFDPQDREKIVDLIARYDRHISFQNAANILLAKEGATVMSSKEGVHEQIREEIEIKKKNMRPPKLSDSDLKRLSQSMEEQEKDIDKLVSPKVAVSKQEIEEAQGMLL